MWAHEIKEIYAAKGSRRVTWKVRVTKFAQMKMFGFSWNGWRWKRIWWSETKMFPFEWFGSLISFIVIGFIPLQVYFWIFSIWVTWHIPLDRVYDWIAFMLVGLEWKVLVNQTPPLKSIAETLLLDISCLVGLFHRVIIRAILYQASHETNCRGFESDENRIRMQIKKIPIGYLQCFTQASDSKNSKGVSEWEFGG